MITGLTLMSFFLLSLYQVISPVKEISRNDINRHDLSLEKRDRFSLGQPIQINFVTLEEIRT